MPSLPRAARSPLAALSAVALLLSLAFAPAEAAAQPAPPPAPAAPVAAGPIEVELLVVRATNTNATVDPSLAPLMRHFQMLKFTGYAVVDRNEEAVAVGDTATFNLEGGRKVKVKLVERTDIAAKLRIQMFRPSGEQQLDTTISVNRNRSFVVAGPRIGDDVLILPVTVRY